MNESLTQRWIVLGRGFEMRAIRCVARWMLRDARPIGSMGIRQHRREARLLIYLDTQLYVESADGDILLRYLHTWFVTGSRGVEDCFLDVRPYQKSNTGIYRAGPANSSRKVPCVPRTCQMWWKINWLRSPRDLINWFFSRTHRERGTRMRDFRALDLLDIYFSDSRWAFIARLNITILHALHTLLLQFCNINHVLLTDRCAFLRNYTEKPVILTQAHAAK